MIGGNRTGRRVRLREVPAVDAEPVAVPALVPADLPVLIRRGQCGGWFGVIGMGGITQSVYLRTAQQRLGHGPLGGAVSVDVSQAGTARSGGAIGGRGRRWGNVHPSLTRYEPIGAVAR